MPIDRPRSLGKIYKLFGNEIDSLIDELNGVLVA